MMKFARKTLTFFRIFPNLPYGVLLKKLPKNLVPFVIRCSRVALRLVPVRFFCLLPAAFSFPILTSSNWLGLSKLLKLNPEDLNINTRNKKSINDFFRTLHYLQKEKIVCDLEEVIPNSSPKFQENAIKEQISWAIWHAGHYDFENIVRKVIDLLNENEELGFYKATKDVRFLRDFCTNMGHLALLFLYVKKYRNSNRTLIVPNSRTANEYFFNLIKENSPLKLIKSQDIDFARLRISEIDTFQYSLNDFGEFVPESEGVSFPSADFPEYYTSPPYFLRLRETEIERGRQMLLEHLGYMPDWFATIHVREPKNGNIKFSQARDANITTYTRLAKSVTELGGLLIRMGDTRFPKLPSNFQAFDYAHSSLRSEFMDVWLWSNCKFWIGNINGAAFPPICFGKPRLLTNQWPWYLHGPSHDFVLRKRLAHIADDIELCESKRVLESRLSRMQDRGWLKRMGFEVRENTEDELDEGFRLFWDFNFGNGSLNSARKKTEELLYLESVLGTPSSSSMMNLIN